VVSVQARASQGASEGGDTLERMSELDRRIVLATQQGLPLTRLPFNTLAEELGVTAELVLTRVRHMMQSGVIRRIGAVPNHYKLGFKANGMSVWDVADQQVSELGRRVGRLDFVSHAYHRPRRLPEWPYNFFAMVHGETPEQVWHKVEVIAGVLGDAQRCHDVLFSTRVLKKTGLRLLNGESTTGPPEV